MDFVNVTDRELVDSLGGVASALILIVCYEVGGDGDE